MARYLAGVLSVIAVGTLLIAYGLLNPRAATADGMMVARPMYASDRAVIDPAAMPYNVSSVPGAYAPYGAYPMAQRAAYTTPAPVREARYEPAIVERAPAPRRVVERAPKRDWKKTAMVIGGSSAAGAGIGALIGGKKGALIGAAIGGGASTIYEVRKR